jgi:putative mRNA 3-end processing factor
MAEAEPLVTVTARGLYCPSGDFFIDPWQPVQTAVITHAHGDHLRHGSAQYILARAGEAIARHRLGSGNTVTAIEYGARQALGAAIVSLHPAGHVLGSAQIRIEHGQRTWVVSGDYKRQADPTCAPLEPLECDVFVSEATFGLPVYRWPATQEVIRDIVGWWQANRERRVASVLFCYALGKAQRVLAELAAFTQETVYVHGAVGALVDLYRHAGIKMVPTASATMERAHDYRGALIIAPPGAAGTPLDAALRRTFHRLLFGLDASARRPAPPWPRPGICAFRSRGLAGADRHLPCDARQARAPHSWAHRCTHALFE